MTTPARTPYRHPCSGRCGALVDRRGDYCAECNRAAAEWAAQFRGYQRHEREAERMERDEREHRRIR